MGQDHFNTFPISELFEPLRKEWDRKSQFIIKADTGAGKSTILPLYILDTLLPEGKIIMLEPRRMAASSLARYCSSLVSRKIGDYAGYRVRGDVRCSPDARLEIVTEGLFLRMIQNDPFLEGVSLVIMDEFHERNLFTDLSFSFLMDVQSNIRADLKLMIMSATAETEQLKGILPQGLFLESRGKMFPVQVFHDDHAMDERVNSERVYRCIKKALEKNQGNILVFLPGEREIQDVLASCLKHEGKDFPVLPLYGRLSPSDQDKALHPDQKPTVILATSIAETSLTIDGITAVIDCGLERKPVFNRHSGFSTLQTKKISKAAAQQRTGRAGRLCEGISYRLWSKEDEALFDDFPVPEIRECDLAPLVVEIKNWGAQSADDLTWLEEPPKAHYHQAVELLDLLQVDFHKLAAQGVHPRLAKMITHAQGSILEQTSCALSAFLSEGDWLPRERGTDILLRMEILKEGRRGPKRLGMIYKSWDSFLKGQKHSCSDIFPEEVPALLCHSFPDRISARRGDDLYQMAGGGNCRLLPGDPAGNSDFIIAPLLGGNRDIPLCFLTAPIEKDLIIKELASLMVKEESWSWNEKKNSLSSRIQRKIGYLVLDEQQSGEQDAFKAAVFLKEHFRKRGLSILPWSKEDKSFLNRLHFVSRIPVEKRPEQWPDCSEAALIEALELWFIPSMKGLKWEGSLKNALHSLLDWECQSFLKEQVPEHFTVPSGSRIRIDYSDPEAPALNVRLQELFGLEQTPLIAGQIPLLFKLLNPAQRPIQITKDLKSFWDNTYQEVRKELRGRYPKHYWPENPYEAEATRRVRPRK